MVVDKPHILCIPFPVQGHINPMMKIAKVLNSRGCFITFINTSFSHNRLLKSQGLDSLDCNSDSFRFEVLPDGLPEVIKDQIEACKSINENCVAPLRDLMIKLRHSSDGAPPLTGVISDGYMTFTLSVAEEVGFPAAVFYPMAACSFMAFLHYPELLKTFAALKEKSCNSNEYIHATVDWIPGMREMQLKDLGSFLQAAIEDPNNFFFSYFGDETRNSSRALMIIFNTLEDLEHDVLDAIRSIVPRVYTIGPLSLLCSSLPDTPLKSVKTSLWKEQPECLNWLDNHKAGSVLYVNFGSTTFMTTEQIEEFAWGIADSKQPFLWIIRPNLVRGGEAKLSDEFMDEIEGRGMLVSWCPQEEVLAHPSVALFLTHCGWNSTLESLSYGVPMLCWPFMTDQQINCRYACKEWGVGMEIEKNVSRAEIRDAIKEFTEGEKGKDMMNKALKWKESAQVAIKDGGSSHSNLELLIRDFLEFGKN